MLNINKHFYMYLLGVFVRMSHSKSVYVLTRGHLNRFQNNGIASCAKCLRDFKENDIIATSSTSKRYCYKCATQINLVTGKVKRDLHNDEFISDVLHHVESIGRKLEINEDIYRLAVLLVTTAIKNTNYVSKNKLGLACAVILLVCKIKKQFISISTLPVSKKTLQQNTSLLQKNLTNIDIYTLSKTIHGLIH